jgi:hypothetical protein
MRNHSPLQLVSILVLIQKHVNKAKEYWDMEKANALEGEICSGAGCQG